ncbi:MAG: hypothetical protein ABSA92_16410 [Candidatus Bathyarchaeia archaeon]|jgi:hypothetical protein
MEPKAALISGLVLTSILIIWYGILSWIYSKLAQFRMPNEAYVIVFGLLMLILVVVCAKIFVKE